MRIATVSFIGVAGMASALRADSSNSVLGIPIISGKGAASLSAPLQIVLC